MSMNEILELSSILQGDDRTKKELEKKNLTLESATEQNESRLIREVEENEKYIKNMEF